MKIKVVGFVISIVLVNSSWVWAQSSPADIRHRVQRATHRSVAQRYVREREQFLQQYRQTFGRQGYVTLHTSSVGPSLRGHTNKMLRLHVPEKAALTCWTLSHQSRNREVVPFRPQPGEKVETKTKDFGSWKTLFRHGKIFIRLQLPSLPGLLAQVTAPEDLMDAYIAGKKKPSQLNQFATLQFCPHVTEPSLRAQLEILPDNDKPYLSVEALY